MGKKRLYDFTVQFLATLLGVMLALVVQVLIRTTISSVMLPYFLLMIVGLVVLMGAALSLVYLLPDEN